jgi:DNA mismatch repair ATPase MutL
VNLSPDKKEIIFKDPELVYDSIKNTIEEFIENYRSNSKMV